ncbi:MAG: hypothetical protein AAGF79_12845 [Pseudomonadota bacterium]
MTDDDKFDDVVGPYLAAARAEDLRLPVGLTARITADAARLQAGWQEDAMRNAAAVSVPVWRQFLNALGGGPALGGLVAACATGIWLGAAPPQSFDPLGYVVDASNTLALYTDVQHSILSEEEL